MRNKSSKIISHDFATSLKQVKPSITKEVDQWYNTIRESISNVVPKDRGESILRLIMTIPLRNTIFEKIKEV